jgi:oligopeptide/dipeptide ABC transporter ATP-binding protein
VSELLRVENLRTEYALPHGALRVVDGVDLVLQKGRTLCLVGESGSGKSQTALSIMGLIAPPGKVLPDSRILFDGKNLASLRSRQLEDVRGNEISMIFQEPMTSLNPAHTVGAQIAEVVRLHWHTSARKAMDRAVEMLTLVGVPAPERRASDYPHKLSGGMRQRVMVAMALACNPRLLIADEPTTALDVTIQAQILDLMRGLRDELGMSILMITHDLGVVAEMADDVAVMYAGRIVEVGSVTDIFSRPRHPYTRALLESIPTLQTDRSRPLNVIPGSMPSPGRWPSGCRFHPRCRYAFDKCGQEIPPLEPAGAGRVACWLYENDQRPNLLEVGEHA